MNHYNPNNPDSYGQLPAHMRRRGGENSQDNHIEQIKGHLGRFCEILLPKDAPHPILAPSVRAALYEWTLELSSASELEAVNVSPRRSALLYGLPGTGKTTFAHYFAARLGLPLAMVRSEKLIDRWLGATGQNIGALLDAMSKTEGRVVIFFDEVDAIGSKRQTDSGASQERANSLNVLLAGIEKFKGIYLAATNRQAHLDDALWRRFGMQIPIELPGFEERFAIIRMYADPFEPSDEDTAKLAEMTVGASPALLRNLIEGMKRSYVMWSKVHRTEEPTLPKVVGGVILSVNPAPEYEKPPLWESQSSLNELSGLQWPWPQKGNA